MNVPENVSLFHCALPILDENGNMVKKTNGGILKEAATHTLAFSKLNDNTLVMGWAASRVEFDGYNKKTGREIALGRIDHLNTRLNDHPNRAVYELEALTPKHLPNKILTTNFDFYLNCAVKALFGEDAPEEVNLVFRSYLTEEPVCSIVINLDEIEVEDEELNGEKVDSEATSLYIFASYVNDEGESIVYVQNRADYEEGYSDEVNDAMVNVLGPVVNNEGFVVVDQHKPILCHEELSEIDVIRALKANGLAYSGELEEDILNMDAE